MHINSNNNSFNNVLLVYINLFFNKGFFLYIKVKDLVCLIL
jgi:hypothetical protein